MSLENEDQSSSNHTAEISREPHWKAKISYTREFLLSLSDLDICKKLPGGFDQSIISEFEDASQERQRISGGLSMHSFRRNEYGTSPPNRGDLSSYSRGTHGRWDSRSRDSDSQSDRDSDCGRRHGNQSRRSWQVPEHDGLLGSGSNPRPSGYTTGQSNPRFQANDPCQLNRSSEPYHPPRPYKAVPHARRDNNDSLDDETFGSSEYTSEDKAEVERKRRDAFELMRKEQLKTFRERQTLTPEKRQGDFDITSLLDVPKDEKKLVDRESESAHAVNIPPSSSEFARSLSAHAPNASRPLVPPGFSSTSLEKNLVMKSSAMTLEAEVAHPELGNAQLHAKGNYAMNQTLNDPEKISVNNISLNEQKHKGGGREALINNDRERVQDLSSDFDAPCEGIGMTSKFPVAIQTPVDTDILPLKDEGIDRENIGLNPNQPNSVLENLFGAALTLENGSSPALIKENKAEEIWSTNTFQSSKFAHWFTEEEKKPVDDFFTVRPNDLFSLIVSGNEKGSGKVLDVKNDFPPQISEANGGHETTEVVSYIDGSPEQLYSSDKEEVVSAVITCEDLEQSMLSGISNNGSAVQEPAQDRALNAVTELPNANIDNHASQHLLFLLQKGPNQNNLVLSSNVDASSSDLLQDIEGDSEHANKSEEETKDASNPLKTLTLETLFGSAFMKELQSVGAPVSVQRGSAVSVRNEDPEPSRFPFPVMDNDLPTFTDDIGPRRLGSNTFASNEVQHKTGRLEEQWFGYNEPQTELGSSQLRHEFSKLSGHDGSAGIRFREEDNLLTRNDPLQNFISSIDSGETKVLSSMDKRINYADNLAPINAAYIDGRRIMGGQERQLNPHLPFNIRESDVPFQNFNPQRSSQVHPSHLNQMGPMFNPLDSHPNINPGMKFINSDKMIHRGSPPNHFLGNMLRPPFQHPSSGLNGFDAPAHQSMLPQMHASGNFPSPQLVRGFPGSVPISAHHNNAVAGLMQESNTMQGFPFGHQQSATGVSGMSLPAEIGGRTHPEALQRLIEMELRSNSKPIRHFGAAGGHIQGLYGNELDMGFGYNRI